MDVIGLKNSRENNCFLNSIIQCLYNFPQIRYSLSLDIPHECKKSTQKTYCLNCEIQTAFIALLFSRNAISLVNIRKALSEIGHISENQRECAVEGLETIFNYYHITRPDSNPSEPCSNECFFHNLFGFDTVFRGSCCEEISEKVTQYNLEIIGTDFLQNYKVFGKNALVEDLLNASLQNNDAYKRYVNCRCNEKALLTKFIVKFPHNLIITLLWDQRNLNDSSDLLNVVHNSIDLLRILPKDREAEEQKIESVFYKFTGMCCYSRHFKHYISILYGECPEKWILVNDESVTNFDSWRLLFYGLKLFKLTPVILFYERLKI